LSTKTKLAAWTKKNVTNKMIAANSNAACGETSSGNGLKDITTVTPPKGDTRWNPPPHRDARGISHAERVVYETNDDLSIVAAFSEKDRGRIFQDSNSAAVLNKNPDKLKELVSAKGSTNQWGFRFMYNPTSFSYSTAANNSIDWTLGSKDTAALLAGNQSVQIQLYINRIVDLSYLNLKFGPTTGMVPSAQGQMSMNEAYGRELSDAEIEGILNRGTEYDLEFLYRCLTGDPQTNNPLLNDTLRKRGSADIGYITGIPLWLYLNDNLRYFGAVAGFEVNHLIFNTEMVPTLSVVTLSFGRYPAQFANDAESLKSVRDNFFPPAVDG
jgi:hypothetical protein